MGRMTTIDHQTIRQFILSCPTFVPKHGDLGRTKAQLASQGFYDPHISIFFWDPHISVVFPCITCILFWWAVLKGGGGGGG